MWTTERTQIGSTQYEIVLTGSSEGIASSCPALRGCHSQGQTRREAVENIRIAIQEWLEAADVVG